METLLFQNVLFLLKQALPEAAVFTETIRQNYQTPALFLALNKCSVRQELDKRFRGEGEFSLRADPGKQNVLTAADMLGSIERCCRGKNGFLLKNSRITPDGIGEASIAASVIGFRTDTPSPKMQKYSCSLSLGQIRKDD